MDNLNEQIQTAIVLQQGRIISAESSNGFSVQVGAARVCAKAAPSCMLLPLVGDTVLVARDSIIAVVARQVTAPSTLRAKHFRLEAETLRMQAQQVTLSADELSLTGRTLTAAAGMLNLVSGAISQVAEQITSTAQRHVRRSSTHDEVHAASAIVRVEGVHEVRGDAIVSHGRQVVRIDGGQVQVG